MMLNLEGHEIKIERLEKRLYEVQIHGALKNIQLELPKIMWLTNVRDIASILYKYLPEDHFTSVSILKIADEIIRIHKGGIVPIKFYSSYWADLKVIVKTLLKMLKIG